MLSTWDYVSAPSAPTPRHTWLTSPHPNPTSCPLPSSPNTGSGSDYKVQVGDKEVPVHRTVLEQRSPFFSGLFRTDMEEAHAGCYVAKDVHEEVMMKVLHFIYTGERGVEGGGVHSLSSVC